MKHYDTALKSTDKKLLFTTCDSCNIALEEFKYHGNGRSLYAYLAKIVVDRDDDESLVVTREYDLCERCFDNLCDYIDNLGGAPVITRTTYHNSMEDQ